MGNPDPTEAIIAETNRLPFKNSTMNPSVWDKLPFRTWPNLIPGWRDWYMKVAAKEQTNCVLHNLGQCISLSLSNMKKNEPLLKAVSYFWSNTYNAFLFGHGTMTPTLADAHMLTGLNITGSANPFSILNKPSFKLDSVRSGGWTNYINIHRSSKNSVDAR